MGRQKLGDLAETYLAMRGKFISRKTLASERTAVGKLARYWDQTRRAPGSLDDAALEDFLYGPDGLASSGIKPASFNTQAAHLKRFLEWLIRRKVIQPNVLDVLRRLPEDRKEYVRISMAQVTEMIETCDDEWERWVLVLASQTLGRDSELKSLKLSDFNLDAGYLRWYRHKTRDADELPITADLEAGYRRWLMHYQEATGELIDKAWFAVPMRVARDRRGNWRYSPIDRRSACLSPIIQAHVTRVTGIPPGELKGQGVHLMRRSMARALYDRLKQQGEANSLRVVQAMLGHANQQTTEIYLGLKEDREQRNALLRGSQLLSVDTSSVIRLEERRHG